MEASPGDFVAIDEEEAVVLEEEVTEMQVAVSEASAAEFFEEVDELFGELQVIGGDAGVVVVLVEVLIEGDGGFEGFEDDGVAFCAGDGESEEGGDGAWGGDGGFLEPLESLEFHEGSRSTEESGEAVAEASARVEFEEVGFIRALESPDLSIGEVFDEFPGVWEISEGLFEFVWVHRLQCNKVRGLSRSEEFVASEGPEEEEGGSEGDEDPADGAALLGLLDKLEFSALPDGLSSAFQFAFATCGVFDFYGGRTGGRGEECDLGLGEFEFERREGACEGYAGLVGLRGEGVWCSDDGDSMEDEPGGKDDEGGGNGIRDGRDAAGNAHGRIVRESQRGG